MERGAGREMEGKTASDRGVAADRWVTEVKKLAKEWSEEGGRLGRYRREAVALGTFVLVGGNSGGGMWLGQVKEIEGSGQWSDVATVAAWVCEEEVVVPRSIEWGGDQWQRWVQGQAWRRTGVEWTVEACNLRPVAVVTTEVEHRGRAPTRVVIDEAWGQVVEWGEQMYGEDANPTGSWSSGSSCQQGNWDGGCWEWLVVGTRGMRAGRS